jgi:hypothetical protein
MKKLILAISNLFFICCHSVKEKAFPLSYSLFESSKLTSTAQEKPSLNALTFESLQDSVLWEGTKINLDIAHFLLGHRKCSIEVFLTFEHQRSWDAFFGRQSFTASNNNEMIFIVPQVAYGYYNLVMRNFTENKDYILMRSVLVTSLQGAYIGRTIDEEFRAQFIPLHHPFLAFWLYISTYSKSKRSWCPLKTLKVSKEIQGIVSFPKCLESSYFHPTEVRYQFYGELECKRMLLLYENAGKLGGVKEEFPISSQIISIVDSLVNLSVSNYSITFNLSDLQHGNIEMITANTSQTPALHKCTKYASKNWKLEEFWIQGNIQKLELPFISFICHEVNPKRLMRNCTQTPISLLPLQLHTLQLKVGQCFTIECNSNWNYFVGELKVEIVLICTATKKKIYKPVWSHKYIGVFNISRICLRICPEFTMKIQKYHIYGPFFIVLHAKFPKNIENWTSLASSKEVYLGLHSLKQNEFLSWLFDSSMHKKPCTSFEEYNFDPQYPIDR